MYGSVTQGEFWRVGTNQELKELYKTLIWQRMSTGEGSSGWDMWLEWLKQGGWEQFLAYFPYEITLLSVYPQSLLGNGSAETLPR
jgi:hypothetical protein